MQQNLKMNDLSPDDRPREKLLSKGQKALTNAELLAILIGSGNKELNAVELSKLILHSADNNLEKIAQYSINQLTSFKGIGEAKAINIISALELAGRRSKDNIKTKSITCSNDAFIYLQNAFMDLQHEEFHILMLSRSNGIISSSRISSGGISGTFVDPKIIFNKVLQCQASSIILAHNHPSGNLQPSNADKILTQKIKQGAKTLDINLFDHLIFHNHNYFSFADEGLL